LRLGNPKVVREGLRLVEERDPGHHPFGLWMAGYQKLRNLRYRAMMQHWESGIMNVSVGDRWEKFVEQAVKAGRYGSASEVVREGLRLVEEREAKLRALRATLDASIAAGGPVTDDQLDAALARRSAELLRKGVGA
jgi:antitoxin ParD1/3/4